MTTAAFPARTRRPWHHALTTRLLPLWQVLVTLAAPTRPVLANMAAIPFTGAGIACIDFAAFHLGHGWGFLATGLSLIIYEHMIADPPAPP